MHGAADQQQKKRRKSPEGCIRLPGEKKGFAVKYAAEPFFYFSAVRVRVSKANAICRESFSVPVAVGNRKRSVRVSAPS